MIDNQPESDAFAAQLANLKPADVTIDPRELFYQAGLAAGRAQAQSTIRKQLTFAVAASVVLTAFSATVLQRVGSAARDSQSTHVSKDSSVATAIDSLVTVPETAEAPNRTPPTSEVQAQINATLVTADAQDSPVPWWLQLAQSVQRTTFASSSTNASANSFPSVYSLGLSTADWMRLAEIPRPVAPPSEDIEFVPSLDDSSISPRDSLRLRSSELFPWL